MPLYPARLGDCELCATGGVEKVSNGRYVRESETIMKTLTKQRSIALGTLGVLSATLLAGPMVAPAYAGSSTWKKVAIGGAAVGAYGLLKGNKKLAVIGGLVGAGSYYKYKKDRKKESRSYRTSRYRRR